MTSAAKLDWPQGEPLFEVNWRAVSEALFGNGILSPGDFEVTPTGSVRELEVATGSVWYDGAVYELESTETDTLSEGDADNDRWDLVVFDTDTEEVVFREGTAEDNPVPEDVEADEVLLAFVYTPAEFDDVYNEDDVLNWRANHQTAAQVRLEDTEDDFDTNEVETALTEVIRKAGDPLNGPLELDDFSGGAVLELGEDPGAFGPIVDAEATDGVSQGTEISYSLHIDGGALFRIYGEADGSGGVENLRVEVLQPLRVDKDIETTGGTTIWDSSEGEVPQDQQGGPAGQFNDYPIELANDTNRDLDGEVLNDSAGPGTLYDAGDEWFVREVIEDAKKTEIVTSTSYTTDGEELILVDTDAAGDEVTLTLSTDDTVEGRSVVVVDIGGEASTNNIVVETEDTEEIIGKDEESIGTDYTGREFVTDGSDWVTPAPAPLLPERQIEGTESGEVADGEQGTLIFDHLEDGETLEISKAIFALASGEPVPTDLNLIIAELDNSGNYTERETIYSGDGSTVWDGDSNSIGGPLASWENDTGGGVTVAVLADNDTGGAEDIMAKVTGERV